MKAIKCDLPSNISMLELHTFADEHIGDEHSDIERIKKRIQYVAEHKNAYCVLNGDILDYASRSSIGDIETREFNIMGQLEKAVELFAPIKVDYSQESRHKKVKTLRKKGLHLWWN